MCTVPLPPCINPIAVDEYINIQSVFAVLYCYLRSVRLYTIFSTFSHKQPQFLKNILNTKCVFLFSLEFLSDSFLLLRRTELDIITNVHQSSCTVPLFLSGFNVTWIFSTDFRRILKYQISLKIRPGGVELFYTDRWTDGRTDGRTDMTKLIVAFCSFENAPKNCCFQIYWKLKNLPI